MHSFASIFEIPATDLDRAIQFYQSILDIPIEKLDIPEMNMGLFPFEEQQIFGMIIQGEGYIPSTEGVTLYLNGGEDLQVALARVEEHGGTILVPKTALADESGFFALFLDTEGNRLGLHSPK
jgi:predicted enzyme related to lactoylglutathione lyase